MFPFDDVMMELSYVYTGDNLQSICSNKLLLSDMLCNTSIYMMGSCWVLLLCVSMYKLLYLRTILAFRYCHCLRLSVCASMHPCVKIPINFEVDWPWSSRSKSTLNSNITSFWTRLHDKLQDIKVRFSKFGPEMHLSTVKIPLDFELDWLWSSIPFSSFKPIFLPNLLHCFCIILVRPLLIDIYWDHRWRPIKSVLAYEWTLFLLYIIVEHFDQ